MGYELLPPVFVYGCYALFGLVIGSFVNVLIGRVPDRESLMTRSACPKCGHEIKGYDNIPIVSWLILRAKCRSCKEPISAQYPLVEALVGILFPLTAWLLYRQYGVQFSVTQVAVLGFVAVGVALTVIDFKKLILPDPLNSAASILAATVWIAYAIEYGDTLNVISRGAVAGLAFGIFYFALWFLTGGRGLGGGDVKLAPSLGLLLGSFSIASAVVGFVTAYIISAIPLGLLMLVGKLKRKAKIPFGPFLLIGAWVGLCFGPTLATLYGQVAGLS